MSNLTLDLVKLWVETADFVDCQVVSLGIVSRIARAGSRCEVHSTLLAWFIFLPILGTS